MFNILILWLCVCLIILSSDIEVNPGPKNNFTECLSICCWNLNNISAHDYSKLFLLKAYILIHKYDIICLSETYIYSPVPLHDDNLVIARYNLVCSDHPSSTKSDGVCLYCKNFELKIGNKSCNFVALCRSPSKSQDDFETSDSFEMALETLAQKGSFLMTIIGDFNAKSCNWYSHNKTRFEGTAIESITSQFRLYQWINEPTHLLQNSSSCIDLTFTSQPNIVVESKLSSSNCVC